MGNQQDMKKTIPVILLVLSIALAIAIIPTTRDEIHWRWASFKNSTGNYKSYLQVWPKGRHSAEARFRYDEHCWEYAVNKDAFWSFHWYLQLHPEGKHVADARDKIETLSWQKAAGTNNIQEYERYLQSRPEGKHVAEARDKIEILSWQKAAETNNIQGYERYLQSHPEGKHVVEARNNIETLRWQEATTANTIKSYIGYITSYPQGRFVPQAESMASDLRTDPALYEDALRTCTEDSLKKFLSYFPGHMNEPQVQQLLNDITEGRDIVDLLNEKKIEIETRGSGIESVQVRLRRLVPYPITVRVHVGTYFVSTRQSSQNMVTTAESKVRLTTDDWMWVSVSTACANRHRDVPGSEDSFTVQKSPHQDELSRLILILDKALVPYAVSQAAVWIVTDNADYYDLGILVRRHPFLKFGGTRQIKEPEAALAMKICSDAGIDIPQKAIWGNREIIFWALNDGEVREWLAKEDKELSATWEQYKKAFEKRLVLVDKNTFEALKTEKCKVYIGFSSKEVGPHACWLAQHLRELGYTVTCGSTTSGESTRILYKKRAEQVAHNISKLLKDVLGKGPELKQVGDDLIVTNDMDICIR